MDNLQALFIESLRKLGVSPKNKILLAVSGGLDSSVLVNLCVVTGLDFGIAHANFQLRGDESERDEQFVRDLALRHHKPFLLKRFDTADYARLHKCSVQVAARNLRYEWFSSFIGKTPDLYEFLITAHHLDDNVETMLMHFFRGTGIGGLKGIPEKNEYIVRPLLLFPRSVIREFAEKNQITWVEDTSNQSDYYTRNFLRNQLLPSIKSVMPDIEINLQNNLQRFSDANTLYNQAVFLHKKKLLKQQGEEFHIPILLLQKTHPLRAVLFEILKEFNFSSAQTGEVIRLMEAGNGKHLTSSTHQIIKNRRWLIIAPLSNSDPSHLIIAKPDAAVHYPEGIIELKEIVLQKTGTLPSSPGTEILDAANIQFPLILRRWKSGDYFYPLGMTKKKKLARFFIDQKLSKTAKEKIWVLISGSQIIYVLGQRIDNRFRTGSSTGKILEIKNADFSIRP